MTSLLVFGLGYSATATLRRIGPAYGRIVATVRDAGRAAAIAAGFPELPVEGVAFDGTAMSPALAGAIAAANHVLVSVPPGEAGDPVLRACRQAFLDGRTRRLVYLSTVGVYGDHGGAWVDEATPPAPTSPRSRARLSVEQAWRDLANEAGASLAILRLSGIYGPGQNAIETVKAGTARRIIKPGQVFNRIHVADIAQAVEAAFARGFDGVVNVTDDEPAPPQDVVAYAARLLGVEPPPETPFETAKLSAMARSFYAENKRVSNALLKTALSVNLSFPDYRNALRALAAGSKGQALQ